MADQRFAQRILDPVEEREHTAGQARFGHRFGNRAADQFAGAGVGGVALHHHATARSEGAGGVAARDREGEREVGGPEHRDGPERDHPQTQVGLGRGAGRIGMVDPQCLPCAVLHLVGEQPQLAHGAPALTVEARFGQTAFLHRALGKRIAERVDLVRDQPQECRALGER